jgi:hypothetical protein
LLAARRFVFLLATQDFNRGLPATAGRQRMSQMVEKSEFADPQSFSSRSSTDRTEVS